MKKLGLIIASSAVIIAAAAGTAFGVGRYNALAEETASEGILTELKAGKYYLENGTDDEYIEVSDGRIRTVGFDYAEVWKTDFADYYASLTDDNYDEVMATVQEEADFWNAEHYYVIDPHIKVVGFSELPPEQGQSVMGECLTYTDENTLIFDENFVYVYKD